jgi:epoxide hydrolase 4
LEGTEFHDERIAGDGVDLHVVTAGTGPPVILLHGFPENWHSWRHQIPELAAAGFSAWAPDLRGYNLSGRPAEQGAYRLQHLVADVVALVNATGHRRAHIVGHDWGGIIAWSLAQRYPELVDKLIILNAPHMKVYLEKVKHPRQMLRSWYVLFFLLPRLPELVLSANSFGTIRRMFRSGPANKAAFSNQDIEGYIGALSQPGALTAALNFYRANLTMANAHRFAHPEPVNAETLVIWGERDPALGVELLDGLHEIVPRVKIHKISCASHWVQNEAPQEVNHALISFLKGNASEQSSPLLEAPQR